MSKTVYLIGALKNPNIGKIATAIRELGFEVFDDWSAPGPHTDEYWQAYEQKRGRGYQEALNGLHAHNVFDFDYRHLARADIVVLVLPCGKSSHMELGWALGQDKKGYVLFPGEPERWDVMYLFADGVFMSLEGLLDELKRKA